MHQLIEGGRILERFENECQVQMQNSICYVHR
jgi:hypothetical protein